MRFQRYTLVLLISLALPAWLWAAPAFEMKTVSTTPVGITSTLCRFGPPQIPAEHGAMIWILDESVYVTLHGTDATPSSVEGGLAPANTVIEVPRASDFMAVAVLNDARFYAVCVPK